MWPHKLVLRRQLRTHLRGGGGPDIDIRSTLKAHNDLPESRKRAALEHLPVDFDRVDKSEVCWSRSKSRVAASLDQIQSFCPDEPSSRSFQVDFRDADIARASVR